MKRGSNPHFPTIPDGELQRRHRDCLYKISYGRLPGTPSDPMTRSWETRYRRALTGRKLATLAVHP